MDPLREEDKPSSIDQLFRDRLQEGKMAPPDDLWSKIDDHLEEERKAKKYDHWYYAVLLLLMPLTLANLILQYDIEEVYHQWIPNPATVEQWMQQELPRTLIPDITHLEDIAFLNPDDAPIRLTFHDKKLIADLLHPCTIMPYDDWLSQVMSEEEIIASSPWMSVKKEESKDSKSLSHRKHVVSSTVMLPPQVSIASLSVSTAVSDVAEKTKLPSIHGDKVIERPLSKISLSERSGWYVGSDAFLNHTRSRIPNPDQVPLVGAQARYHFNTSPAFGITMGYTWNSKASLEAGWIFHSTIRQTYENTSSRKLPIYGDIRLKYHRFPLLGKYKISHINGLTSLPVSFNWLAGVEYGLLRSSFVNLKGDLDGTPISQLYNRHELGVLLGFEYDMFFHPNWFASLGFRSILSSSPNQLFRWRQPSSTHPMNAVLGINLSIRYFQAKKQANEYAKPE